MVSECEPAPEFALPNQDGEVIRLSMFRGRNVVLYFYPRALTPGCTREAKRFNELIEEFHRLNTVVLGVSSDPIERIKKFHSKLGLRFDLLSDPDGSVIKTYGVLKPDVKRISALRTTFIIDGKGVIKAILRNIRPAEKHADKALEIIKSLS